MTINEIMGSRIKECRKEADLTQEKLGEIFGLNRQAVSKWETGRVSNLKRETIGGLSKLFNVSPMWLMGYDVPKQASDLEVDTNIILQRTIEDMVDRYDSFEEIPEDRLKSYFTIAAEAAKVSLLQGLLRKQAKRR